jgi:2'-hydroxyisoflavone reductase
MGLDEAAATVVASPDAEAGEYPALKRGAEIALTEAFGERAVLLRAGLILGPGENVGRLPWWLARMAQGGTVLCPGPRDLPLQYIDARDLAAFALQLAGSEVHGPLNTVSPRGHTTMGELLAVCAQTAAPPGTELRWVAAQDILAAGIEPWMELPIWIPPGHEYEGMHGADVRRALAAGLRCRPVADTVADTWAWMAAFGAGGAPVRAGRPVLGLGPAREREFLAGR